MKFDEKYILTALGEADSSLITPHYINEVLPATKHYKEFHLNRLMAIVDDAKIPLAVKFSNSKELNERQVEDTLIRPILESLGNVLKAQIPLNSDKVDFCVYTPNEEIKPDGFADNYANTTAIIESKRYGRIENKYYIQKKDNTDEIYQTLNYLNTMNLTLANNKNPHRVPFAVLTDGYKWRIYSKNYTHNLKEYESHFIEFNLEAIVNCPDREQRNHLLKLFGIFFSKESLAGELVKYQKASSELETAVTVALKEQTYTSLEYIATGIWRAIIKDENPLLINILKTTYDVDVEKSRNDEEERAKLLKIIYDESLVFLLRMLFVLYAEDRNLFNSKEIPKVIKGENNILDLIIAKNKGIGEITDDDGLDRNDDLRLADVYTKIDKKYNGGLFSQKKHPLLFGLNIDDTLFANAVDNLCRVQLKKQLYTVDFSAISVRELGSIYESLLEYKLAVIDKDIKELPSIINKKRVRHNVAKGDLYLINHAGERKATGSYYTPDLIVEHLVRTALNPKLEAAKKAHSDNFKELFKAVLDIKVCDPAMGSGHMLQACYSRIVSFLHQTVEEMFEKGNKDAVWTSELEYYVRTQVARKCIYGADLNPYAVEIAKLVLWMKVFNKDKPFEFFDYNLACGNSLIGIYEKFENASDFQSELFKTHEVVEADIRARLLYFVSQMIDMPRDSIEAVHAVEKFYQETVRPLQREASFAYNVKIGQWLLPEKTEIINTGYDVLVHGVDDDIHYIEKILKDDPCIPESVKALKPIEEEVRDRFRPLHWSVAYPHIAFKGGFDVILSNPPWDKVKTYRNEFFSDYIDGYADIEASDAIKISDAFMEQHPNVKQKWETYCANIYAQIEFYQNSYHYQTYKPKDGKKALKGDANLYKVFLEKIYDILGKDGLCGIVIPDNLNIDNGCTGLRHMLLENTTINEMIMFENRKKLFDIHGQYKFNVLTFEKSKARANAAFDAGFYWYDPVWLDGIPTKDYIEQDEKNKKKYHSKFSYSVPFIQKLNPELLTIYEFRNGNAVELLKKLIMFPEIGDETQTFYVTTFSEFHMTNDSDLFNKEGKGWPLYQGRTIHHYNSHLNPIERYVVQSEGEARLAKKWKIDVKNLPDRTYRIGWRDIAQPTDTRSLICTIVPRGVFCGNALNQAIVYFREEKDANENVQSVVSHDYELISGLNVVFSSFSADMYIRIRIAKHVSAFILKSLPVPREYETIKELGRMALPLYDGDEFEAFRGEVAALTDEEARTKLIAKLDARVAIMYDLSYEEYQAVLETFPLVDEQFKKRCLLAFNDWKFSM